MPDDKDKDLLSNSSAGNYDESKVKTLSSLEHIRQRPGMYIGRLGDGSHPDDGIYVLLKEVIDNSVDEYIMGAGRRIDVEIKDNVVSVRDYGRGIPLGKLAECVSEINTGAKYNSEVFQFSVGLNGVGTKAVNALSERFSASSFREGKSRKVSFERGVIKDDTQGKTTERNGTLIAFTPDRIKFPDVKTDEKGAALISDPKTPIKYVFNMEYVEKRLWMYAFLNSGLSLYLNGQRFFSKNGLQDLVDTEAAGDQLYKTVYFKDKTLEFAFTHGSTYGETYYSFVNGQYTNDGGTHLSAFKEGLLRAINEFSGKSFQSQDIRDGVVGAIAIKLQDPVFESQTKNKLGNTDVKGWIVGVVKDAVVDYMHRHTEEAQLIIEKVERNEALRKDIQAIQKQSREKAKKMNLKIPKLKDCKHHFSDRSQYADETMIFLTEGDSAAGSMVSSRNVLTQAIFSLKGKPMNCFNEKIDKVYANEELYYIMKTLNIEEDLDELRYAKVVIATDADVDGLHIRNLLITYFLTFFEQLISKGHVFILETPLFRVRNKKETVYCYSEEERDDAVKRLGVRSAEVTRFKGLGEISPSEFGQFIGEDIRLVKVTVDNTKGVSQMLKFYMGDNTPDRREHIMKNLV